MLVEKQEIDCR